MILKRYCKIFINRPGKTQARGIFLKHAKKTLYGALQAKIINERGMIEYIPKSQIEATAI